MNIIKFPNNFAYIEEKYSNYAKSKTVILPVPYAGTVSYGKGASKGPSAIIKASQNMELYDEGLDKNNYEAQKERCAILKRNGIKVYNEENFK